VVMEDEADRPLSVPAGCIDLFPPELRPTYWKMFPRGQEMPATVPKKLWRQHMRRRLGEKAEVPPPPPLWLNYWDKVDGPSEPRVPKAFWGAYFDMFPDGHFPRPKTVFDFSK
jgi:hypothetical protein